VSRTVLDLIVADEVDLPEAFFSWFSVIVLEPVTDSHPNMIEVTVKNVADERSLILLMQRVLFGSVGVYTVEPVFRNAETKSN